MDYNVEICPHIEVGPYPFDVEFVLDEYMGIAEAVVRCKSCRQRYMINLVDWVPPTLRERTFTVRLVEDNAYQRFAHDVSKDYCDLTRKQSEAHALTTASPLLDSTVCLNVQENRVLGLGTRTRDTPTSSWRDRLL